MKLYVKLFYALLIVFIIGVVLLCFIDPAAVWSRIATGLVTGSFLGIDMLYPLKLPSIFCGSRRTSAFSPRVENKYNSSFGN